MTLPTPPPTILRDGSRARLLRVVGHVRTYEVVNELDEVTAVIYFKETDCTLMVDVLDGSTPISYCQFDSVEDFERLVIGAPAPPLPGHPMVMVSEFYDGIEDGKRGPVVYKVWSSALDTSYGRNTLTLTHDVARRLFKLTGPTGRLIGNVTLEALEGFLSRLQKQLVEGDGG